MEKDSTDQTPIKRLQRLQEVDYPLSAVILNAVPAEQRPKLSPDVNPAWSRDKQKMDETLAQWVSGELNSVQATEKLFPFAVHYRYASTPKDKLHELSSRQQQDYPLAKMIVDAWFALVEDEPPSIQDKYLEQLLEVEVMHDIGFSIEGLKRHIEKRNKPDTPGR